MWVNAVPHLLGFPTCLSSGHPDVDIDIVAFIIAVALLWLVLGD
jgi:hypothetical protein